MEKIVLLTYILASGAWLQGQSLNPSAQFKFDSSLVETISGLVPDSSAAIFNYGNDETGETSSALELTSGYLLMADPAFTQFGLNDFSMSLWFKRTASLWPTEWLVTKNSPSGYFRLRYNGFFDQMNFYFRPSMDSTELTVGTASQTVGTGWNLCTIAVDRDSLMSMYLNNNLVFTKDISHVVSYPADFVGGDFKFGTGDIVLNDLVFFNKALSLEEVSIIYNSELSIDDHITQSVVIYPNPTNYLIHIKSSDYSSKPYAIYALQGTIVQTGIVINNEIDIRHIAAGQYILRLSDQNYSIIIK